MEGLKIWYDPEGDFLEVNFARKPGQFQATPVRNMLVKIDDEGHIVGFSVLNISEVAEAPMEIEIPFAQFKQPKFPALNDQT
jgi:uncharacterized protein YuzE